MKNKGSRRIAPLAAVTAVIVSVLIVFELAIMGGVLQLRGAEVAKYAPWIYEPFLKLVGEHPNSKPAQDKQTTDRPVKDPADEALTILSETNTIPKKPSVILDPTIPEGTKPKSHDSRTDESAPVG